MSRRHEQDADSLRHPGKAGERPDSRQDHVQIMVSTILSRCDVTHLHPLRTECRRTVFRHSPPEYPCIGWSGPDKATPEDVTI